MSDTLVLALGNPLRGDDGVGAAVLEYLNRQPLPGAITLLDGGTAGLETVLLMQDYATVYVVDAADMGKPAGEWARFTRDEVQLQARDLYLRGTLHYAGLAEALSLAEALDLLPDQLVIYGIQPAEIGWTPGLTPAVAAAVPAVSQHILQDIQR